MKTCDCLIVGGGSAALACALSLYQQGIHDVVIVERDNTLGGVLKMCIRDRHHGCLYHFRLFRNCLIST